MCNPGPTFNRIRRLPDVGSRDCAVSRGALPPDVVVVVVDILDILRRLVLLDDASFCASTFLLLLLFLLYWSYQYTSGFNQARAIDFRNLY